MLEPFVNETMKIYLEWYFILLRSMELKLKTGENTSVSVWRFSSLSTRVGWCGISVCQTKKTSALTSSNWNWKDNGNDFSKH